MVPLHPERLIFLSGLFMSIIGRQSKFFCENENIDLSNSMQNHILNNFSSERFVEECVMLPKTERSKKKFFFGLIT